MQTRRRVLYTFKRKQDSSNVIEVDLFYSMGGMNYFTGSVEPRGYYVSVQPANVGPNFHTIQAFSGTKSCVESAKSFSQKKFDSYSIYDSSIIKNMLAWVCTRNKISIEDYECDQPFRMED